MTATQAPTPGPLSAFVRGAANGLCNRSACLAPLADEPQHQFMDGIFTGGPRLHYCAKCAADFDAWDYRSGDMVRIQREPKSLDPRSGSGATGLIERLRAIDNGTVKERPWIATDLCDEAANALEAFRLAPTAPVENPDEPCAPENAIDWPTAPVEASGSGWEQVRAEIEKAFSEGITPQEIIALFRPQPSGETREAVLLKQLREAVRDYWQGKGAQAAGGYAKWAAVCDALQAYDRDALSTTLARAEAQDEGAAVEVVTALLEADGFYEAAGLPITAERLRGLAERYSAHPSPTPAADDDRVRETMQEAIDLIAHLKPEKARFKLEQALAALKSEGK